MEIKKINSSGNLPKKIRKIIKAANAKFVDNVQTKNRSTVKQFFESGFFNGIAACKTLEYWIEGDRLCIWVNELPVKAVDVEKPANEKNIVRLKVDEVAGNPQQPRKKFNPQSIDELAESMSIDGQRQPGEVIPIENIIDLEQADFKLDSNIKYLIIGGERRYKACVKASRDYEAVVCTEKLTLQEILIRAIVENEQREDPSEIENANAYKALSLQNLSFVEIAKLTGKKPSYIKSRVDLLLLNNVYQLALTNGGLTIGQAAQLVRLNSSGQDSLVRLIEAGKCKKFTDVCAAADMLLAIEQQQDFFGDMKPMTPEEKQKISWIESSLNSVKKFIGKGFNKDNKIIISTKIPKHQAAKMANEIGLIISHLKMLEDDLRKSIILQEIKPEKLF